ncbi:MAG: hypothetical protein HY320_07560 [Armatimonadetes bacterium]|nr:hypothetical protein [Armatimonadota bacterium]
MTRIPISISTRCGCLMLATLYLASSALAKPAQNSSRRRPPVLPPVRGLSYRGAAGGPARTAVDRRVAALQLQLKEARAGEAQARQKLAQVQAALETISAEYLKLKQELQDRAEASLSTRQMVLLQIRRRLGAVEVDLIRARAQGPAENAEKTQSLVAEKKTLEERIAALETEERAAKEPPRPPAPAHEPDPPPTPKPPSAAPSNTDPDPKAPEAVRTAEASVREAETERERVRQLVATGLMPQAELGRVERDLAWAQTNLAGARARQQRDLPAAIAAAEARVSLARDALTQAEQEMARLERLHTQGAVATQEVATQQERLAQARAAAETAQAALQAIINASSK